MATYKLHYFDLYGLSEPIKFLLLYGDLPYENKTISFDEWKAVQGDYQFGKLPVLEFDGKVLNQSNAICRFLAKKLRLAGDDDWDAARIDALADTITDMRLCVMPYFMESDDKVAEENHEKMKTVQFPSYLSKFDEIVSENNGYFVNGKLSWVDLMFISLDDYLCFIGGGDIFAGYKNLSQLREKVKQIPQIKNYLESREEKKFFTRAEIKPFLNKEK